MSRLCDLLFGNRP